MSALHCLLPSACCLLGIGKGHPLMGTLYIVATPIGNLEDLGLRALRVLKEVDLIACEDTRHTAKLLNHYGIDTPRESYHEHNEARRSAEFVERLRAGKNIALVTDAGMPLISDPGHTLVSACRREGIPVIPVPGPSAVLAALAGSGLPADRFLFAGFLSPKSSQRRKELQELAPNPYTVILYEAPHRLLRAFEDMCEIFGSRQACLARELTKVHEEWLTGSLPEILEVLRSRPAVKGEITIVIAPGESPAVSPEPDRDIRQDLEEELKSGISRKEALKAVARRRGLSRREAYRLLLEK